MRKRRLGALIAICIVAFGGLLATILTDSSPELGLDLQGGASVVLQPPDGTPSESLDQAIEIIRSRVDALGVAEPDIVRQGDTVLVELPGVKDQQRALEIVGQTAELRFRPVLNILPPEGVEPEETTTTTTAATTTTATGETTTTTAPGETTTTTAPTTTTTTPSTTPREQDTPEVGVVLPHQDGSQRFQLGPATVLGSAVSTARATFDGVSTWAVQLEMTSAGIDSWNALATECFNGAPTCPGLLAGQGQIAITLDGEVVSAPTVNAPTFDRDDISITGGFSEGEAKDLALILRYGALPVQLEQQDAQTVSATLGEDSLRAGLIAGAVGTALVLLYMFFYYRILGIVVLTSLGVWAALQWSVISWLGETQGLALSLAGVTGIVVSIGVTVDSFVVLFERMKDEVRAGSTARVAADRGFRHAFRTTIIADTSALIGAVTLYLLTVGPVRGFAFFLGLSTVLDVVVFYFFTRPLVAQMARRKGFATGSFMGSSPTPVPVGGGGA